MPSGLMLLPERDRLSFELRRIDDMVSSTPCECTTPTDLQQNPWFCSCPIDAAATPLPSKPLRRKMTISRRGWKGNRKKVKQQERRIAKSAPHLQQCKPKTVRKAQSPFLLDATHPDADRNQHVDHVQL